MSDMVGIPFHRAQCEKHGLPRSEVWCSDAVSYVHGNYTMLCKACVLERQIAHAEGVSIDLPRMREELAMLIGGGDELSAALEPNHE